MTNNFSDPVYKFYQDFFELLAAGGITDVVISPGGRSAVLAVCANNTFGYTSATNNFGEATSKTKLTKPLENTSATNNFGEGASSESGFNIWIKHDERSAGFFALGMAKASKQPVALICTSGTAGANYTPAVIEAFQSGVPLLVLTADRPPHFRGKGFEQTIFQKGLYGKHLQWFYEMPLIARNLKHPNASKHSKNLRFSKQSYGSKEKLLQKITGKIFKALYQKSGPVHINCPFDEPLEPQIAKTTNGEFAIDKNQDDQEKGAAKNDTQDITKHALEQNVIEKEAQKKAQNVNNPANGNQIDIRTVSLNIGIKKNDINNRIKPSKLQRRVLGKLVDAILENPCGLILAGPEDYDEKTISATLALSQKSGWPILADGASAFRNCENVISTAHLLFSGDFYRQNKPDTILRLGAVPTNKIIRTEIAKNPPKEFFWCDPKGQNYCADFPSQNRIKHHDIGELLELVCEEIFGEGMGASIVSSSKNSNFDNSQKISEGNSLGNTSKSLHQEERDGAAQKLPEQRQKLRNQEAWSEKWQKANLGAREIICREFKSRQDFKTSRQDSKESSQSLKTPPQDLEKPSISTSSKSSQDSNKNLTEPEISYYLAKHLPPQSNLFLANSFAIRDFDAFGCIIKVEGQRADCFAIGDFDTSGGLHENWAEQAEQAAQTQPEMSNEATVSEKAISSEAHLEQANFATTRIFCNRGANGIDGLISTALGIAVKSQNNFSQNNLPKTETYLLAGDTAILHDLSALLSPDLLSSNLSTPATLNIIIINNNGGAIFEALPLAKAFRKNSGTENLGNENLGDKNAEEEALVLNNHEKVAKNENLKNKSGENGSGQKKNTDEKNLDTFEKLFIAPTGLGDFQFLNSFPNVNASLLESAADLKEFLESEKPAGINIAEFQTSIQESMNVRRKIKAQVNDLIHKSALI